MKIQFAKSKSDVIAKQDGTFVPRKRRKVEQPEPANEPASAVETSVPVASAPSAPVARPMQHSLPNKILFAQDLPGFSFWSVILP